MTPMRSLPSALRALVGRRGGTAGVEFALVLPVILVAIIGLIEGGRLVYTQTALHFAAQEATRFAVVREGQVTHEQIQDFAEGRLIGLKSGLAVFTIQSPPDPEVGTSEYTVEIAYQFTPLVPYIERGDLTLTARSSGFVAFQSVIPTS